MDLLARGDKIGQHRMQDAQQADAAMRAYIRSTVTTPPTDLDAITNSRGSPARREPGFVHDSGMRDSTGAAQWAPGRIEVGFWTGRAKLGRRSLVAIEAYRCTSCHRLELCAFPQPGDAADGAVV